jgi:hypothetical protein
MATPISSSASQIRNSREGLPQRRQGHEVRRCRERRLAFDWPGVARQPAWIDYDGDGDLDLFAAFRDVPNRLLRNDRGKFVDVTDATGIGDPRKRSAPCGGISIAMAIWISSRRTRRGDANGLYRQANGRFEDVAAAMGVAGTPRPKEDGWGRAERCGLRSGWRTSICSCELRPERALSQ